MEYIGQMMCGVKTKIKVGIAAACFGADFA
jgi:hypothetical protein